MMSRRFVARMEPEGLRFGGRGKQKRALKNWNISQRMKLSVTRLDSQGRYETMIVRDDGVRFMLERA